MDLGLHPAPWKLRIIIWSLGTICTSLTSPGILLAGEQGGTARSGIESTESESVSVPKFQSWLHGLSPDEQSKLPLAAFVAESLLTRDLAVVYDALQRKRISAQEGSAALLLATSDGERALIGVLLDAGLLPDLADADGVTPLMMAVLSGRSDNALYLIERGADPYLETRDGLSAVAIARNSGAVELLTAIGDIPPEPIAWQPLFAVLDQRKHSQLRALLAAGLPADVSRPDGVTALMWATQLNDIEAVRVLLEAGADVDQVAADGSTALLLAIQSGVHALTELLLAHGASADGPANAVMPPLAAAIFVTDDYVCQRLIDVGVKGAIWRRDGEDVDLIELAQKAGLEEISQRLTGNPVIGGSVDPKALLAAVIESQSPLVYSNLVAAKRLTGNTVLDESGTTVLQALLMLEPFPFQLWGSLLSTDPDIEFTDTLKRNGIHIAAAQSPAHALRDLLDLDLERGSRARHAVDSADRTALMYAVAGGSAESVKMLLDSGVDVLRSDSEGLRPLELAKRLEKTELLEILVSAEKALIVTARPAVELENDRHFDSFVRFEADGQMSDYPSSELGIVIQSVPAGTNVQVTGLVKGGRWVRMRLPDIEEAFMRSTSLHELRGSLTPIDRLIGGNAANEKATAKPLQAAEKVVESVPVAQSEREEKWSETDDIKRQVKDALQLVEEAQRRLDELQRRAGFAAAESTTPAPPVIEPAVEFARLTVEATPRHARVRVMNIVPRYTDGIELAPGAFDIEVSASGHVTHRRLYQLPSGDHVLKIALDEQPVTPVIPKRDGTAQDRLGIGALGPELVLVPGGSHHTGGISPDDDNPGDADRTTTIHDFYLSKNPITVDELRIFLGATRYQTTAERPPSSNQFEEGGYEPCLASETGSFLDELKKGRFDWRRGLRTWKRPGFEQSGRHPAVCVSWADVNAYIKWLSAQTGKRYRLPTEAEWEFAANAGETVTRTLTENPDHVCEFANIADQSFKRQLGSRQTAVSHCDDGHAYSNPVGYYAQSKWGLSDMLGNVWEWQCSSMNEQSRVAERRCEAVGDRQAIRGGSWSTPLLDLTISLRQDFQREGSRNDLGFRVVRE